MTTSTFAGTAPAELTFTPTPLLRWLVDDPVRSVLEPWRRKLQQQFLGSDGTVEWRDVPTVSEGEV